MRQLDHRQPRECCSCKETFAPEQIKGPAGLGWTPLRRGWRCPACTRTHRARIDAMARGLVDSHTRCLWVATQEHAEFEECVWCDVLRRASDLILERPPPPQVS